MFWQTLGYLCRYDGCKNSFRLLTMINIVLLPNESIYHYFSSNPDSPFCRIHPHWSKQFTLPKTTLLGTNIPLSKALLSRWFSFSQGGTCDRSLEGNISLFKRDHFFQEISASNHPLFRCETETSPDIDTKNGHVFSGSLVTSSKAHHFFGPKTPPSFFGAPAGTPQDSNSFFVNLTVTTSRCRKFQSLGRLMKAKGITGY